MPTKTALMEALFSKKSSRRDSLGPAQIVRHLLALGGGRHGGAGEGNHRPDSGGVGTA